MRKGGGRVALKNVNVVFGADTTGYDRGLKRVQGGLASLRSSIGSLVTTSLGLAGVALGLQGIAESMRSFVGLESAMMRSNELFGEAAKYVTYFAETTAKGLGMAEATAYQYAATYGNLFKNITKGTEENAKVTIAMLKASAVVASKTGRTMTDVNDRIRSGILGSTEAIEDLGINVNVAMLETTEAFKRIADGRTWEKLTFQEQQQIRVLAILEQAHKNYGDTVTKSSGYSLQALGSAFKDLVVYAGLFVNAGLQPVIGALTQLVQWATAGLKALAALMGLQVKTGPAKAIGNQVGAQETLTDEIKKTDKAARQMTAGFDVFNDITKADGSADTASAAGGAPADSSPFAGLAMPDYELTKPDTTWVDALTDGIGRFKQLLAPTAEALDGLWGSLQPFGSFLAQGARDFYTDFLVPVGGWVLGDGLPLLITALSVGLGSVNWGNINEGLRQLWDALVPFALTIGAGLVGFWENVLVPIGVWTMGEGLPRFIEAIANGLGSVDWGPIGSGLDGLWSALAPFAVNVGEGLLWLWENVLVPFGTWTLNDAVPVFLGLLSGAIGLLNTIIEVLAPLGEWLWDVFLKPFLTWAGDEFIKWLELLSRGITAVSDWIRENQGLVQNIILVVGSFAAAWGLVNTAVGLWNTVAGIATGATTIFGGAVAFLTSPIGIAIAAVGALIAIGVLLYKNWDTVKAKASELWEGIKAAFSPVGEFFEGVVSGVIRSFRGLIDFIAGVFTGDWERVWKGIGDFFGGIWDGMKGMFRGAINAIIDTLNSFVRGINRLKFDVPSWVPIMGGKSFGFNIPEIPRLATGGLAYDELTAVIGDNFNAGQDPEVVSPLSTLKAMILEALMQKEIATGGDREIRLILTLEDGETLVDMLIDPMNRKAKNLGYAPVFKPA